MRKMKKIAVLCLAGSMALSLAACSGGSAAETSQAASQTAALAEAAQETTVSAKEEPAEEAEQAKEWGPIFADIVQSESSRVS